MMVHGSPRRVAVWKASPRRFIANNEKDGAKYIVRVMDFWTGRLPRTVEQRSNSLEIFEPNVTWKT
jgi:hypothetical protein